MRVNNSHEHCSRYQGFYFDMAHSLTSYEGKCKHIHGQTYILSVTISGRPSTETTNEKTGMVMDFADLKEIVQREIKNIFDPMLVLWEEDVRFQSLGRNSRFHLTPYQPTCENLLVDFAGRLKRNFKGGTKLKCAVLRDTPSCSASPGMTKITKELRPIKKQFFNMI